MQSHDDFKREAYSDYNQHYVVYLERERIKHEMKLMTRMKLDTPVRGMFFPTDLLPTQVLRPGLAEEAIKGTRRKANRYLALISESH